MYWSVFLGRFCLLGLMSKVFKFDSGETLMSDFIHWTVSLEFIFLKWHNIWNNVRQTKDIQLSFFPSSILYLNWSIWTWSYFNFQLWIGLSHNDVFFRWCNKAECRPENFMMHQIKNKRWKDGFQIRISNKNSIQFILQCLVSF